MLFENVLCTELKIIPFIYCMEWIVGFLWFANYIIVIQLSS